MLGIDVSYWQGKIDWKRVVNDPQGVNFTYLRACYGIKQDKRFAEYKDDSRGLLERGAYLYYLADEGAFKQAATLLGLCAEMELPPALDIEVDHTWLTREHCSIALGVQILVESVAKFHPYPAIYTNLDSWPRIAKYLPPWVEQECQLWVADHTRKPPRSPWSKPYWIHQFSTEGCVEGITGKVDMNEMVS
jgi:lysozyme